jgi:outer membrane protein
MKMFQNLILPIILFNYVLAISDVKIGYVDSNEIMKNIEEVRQAQIDLEKEGRKLEAEGMKLVNKLDSLKQDYDRQRLLMSEIRRKEKEKEMTLMEQSIQQFQLEKFGPEGEIYRRQVDLMKPITNKINAAINIVGKEQGYDIILDALSGAIVYALPQHDLTESVLEELTKKTESETD